MAEIFKTERLSVRHAEPADADFFVALLNDPGFLANIGDRAVRTKGDAETYIIARIASSYARDAFGFFVVDHEGEPVGICGLIRRDGLDAPDLGFAFLERHVRRGFGLEAAAATIDWAREVAGLDRLLAITTLENAASIGLLTRLGFREIGIMPMPAPENPSRIRDTNLSPFALSLSKGCPSPQARKGQCFDRLGTNGNRENAVTHSPEDHHRWKTMPAIGRMLSKS